MTSTSRADQLLADRINADARALLGTPAAFGPRKVFLSEVLGPVAAQDMADVERLRRAGLVMCARADLVSAMDPALVAASEWRLDGATFHFLVVEP